MKSSPVKDNRRQAVRIRPTCLVYNGCRSFVASRNHEVEPRATYGSASFFVCRVGYHWTCDVPVTASNPFKWRHYPGDIIL
jgi:hypothetical protein